MTIRQALLWGTKKLQKTAVYQRGVHEDTPVLDAEVFLMFAVNKPKVFLFTHQEKKLTKRQLEKFKSYIQRRNRHEPVAYITRHKEFYGFDFLVNSNVLIPRPETETIIDALREQIKDKKGQIIADVGSGSGCLIITLAKLFPKSSFFATEISKKALVLAKKNAQKHGVLEKIKFFHGDLLRPLTKVLAENKVLVIVANLPYLTTKQWKTSQPEIRNYEPQIALDGGRDGLNYYRELFEQLYVFMPPTSRKAAERPRLSRAPLKIRCAEGAATVAYGDLFLTGQAKSASSAKLSNRSPLSVIIEIDPRQTAKIKKIILNHFSKAKIKIKQDLSGLDRCVIAELDKSLNKLLRVS